MIAFLIGLLSGLVMGIAFILFCLWHSKRYPLIKDDTDGTELADTTIYSPPSYHLRVVK